MKVRKLASVLAVAALAVLSGCHSSRSYRATCVPACPVACPAPAVVSSAPVAIPAAPAPCCNGAVPGY